MDSYYAPTVTQAIKRRAHLSQFKQYNERALMAIWSVITGKPHSYLDIGCGSGDMVRFARSCGVTAVGVDVVAESPDIQADLRRPLRLSPSFQLVTCLEVAEHLPAESADTLVQSIVDHLDVGGYLVFSAAIPGQQGDYHVNCQQPIYWREKFWPHKVNYDPELTRQLMFVWYLSAVTGPLMHLPANVQVFRKGDSES